MLINGGIRGSIFSDNDRADNGLNILASEPGIYRNSQTVSLTSSKNFNWLEDFPIYSNNDAIRTALITDGIISGDGNSILPDTGNDYSIIVLIGIIAVILGKI